MDTTNIGDITIRNIFEQMLGEEDASKVLLKIQKEYEKGTSGEELATFAKEEIQKYSEKSFAFLPAAAAAAAIIIFHKPTMSL